MLLSTLLTPFFSLPTDMDRDISRLILDSRQIQPNDAFIAIKGTQSDGRAYIDKAITQGAIAILVDAEVPNESLSWRENIPLIPIQHLQNKLGELAARFYHHPANHLYMIGVTGTNGKTSCTHFIAQILQRLHTPCGIIGTLGSGFYGALGTVGLTTPDAITLQALLADFQAQHAKAIAMEVSSHSIDQGRVNGIPFELGIFTNLTQDHLDYHGDMETYANVKKRFLAEFPTKQLILNAEDPYGKRWLKELTQQKSVIAYSTQSSADVYTDHVKLSLQGITAQVHTPWGEGALSLPLIGQFNLSNALAVLTALCLYGIPLPDVLQQLAHLEPVPGRMQTYGGHGKPLVVVDYSHTPDALERALQALRAHTQGKLICVFGCGGNRDTSKRPVMAKIAEKLADQVIVTNDNPRHEDPEEIAKHILQGFLHPERVTVLLDRSKAIQNSIQCASASDCILIAGKGAERYQQIGDEKIPFDDREQVRAYL
ncbi:MAG: UDP-N-acetylmuramoyl-L-alanyl-D-glutamate--2,6-diaminopimelate ligase [Gammaproteobacteria bacterium]|nr:MAG: UDP-N-acetylmuramoyl-L-alanyl-D-glutamate--2,6-diaminopimelate ligase [Gammaproteobacteria bacterium]